MIFHLIKCQSVVTVYEGEVWQTPHEAMPFSSTKRNLWTYDDGVTPNSWCAIMVISWALILLGTYAIGTKYNSIYAIVNYSVFIHNNLSELLFLIKYQQYTTQCCTSATPILSYWRSMSLRELCAIQPHSTKQPNNPFCHNNILVNFTYMSTLSDHQISTLIIRNSATYQSLLALISRPSVQCGLRYELRICSNGWVHSCFHYNYKNIYAIILCSVFICTHLSEPLFRLKYHFTTHCWTSASSVLS